MKLLFVAFNIVLLFFIPYWIWSREKSLLRKFFWPSFLLKIGAGICIGLVYTYYYTVGDTFNYFEDGVKLAQLARTDFGSYLSFLWSGNETDPIWSSLLFQQPRAMFMAKITSIFCLLTRDNYWIISLYFSSLAFVCAWWLVKKISAMHPSAANPAVLSFLFFPSVVFWSSGLIKESLALAALFFLSSIFLKVWKKETPDVVECVLSLLSLWLVWSLKYYYLAVFMPVALTTLAVRFLLSRFGVKSLFPTIVLWSLVFFIPLVLVSLLHPNFYPHRFMDVIVSSYHEFHAISNPEDLIYYNSLKATPLSIFQNMPLALFSGMFRPFITEAHSLFQFFIAIENLALLILFLFALTGLRKLKHTGYSLILFSIIVYTVLLCIFLALSTPNFGTLSRYRVGFLPYLVFLLAIENPLGGKLVSSGTKILQRLVR